MASLHICACSPEPSSLDNESHVLAQMAISVSFMRTAKALVSLHSRYADSERAGESAHLHSLGLHNSNLI